MDSSWNKEFCFAVVESIRHHGERYQVGPIRSNSERTRKWTRWLAIPAILRASGMGVPMLNNSESVDAKRDIATTLDVLPAKKLPQAPLN